MNKIFKGYSWLFTVCLLCLANFSLAQKQSKITGTVLDQDGQPIEAVSVTAKQNGRSVGSTMSAADGRFVIEPLQAESTYDLSFDHVSYDQHIESGILLKDSLSGIFIRLNKKDKDLDEIVVTALGIKRSEKRLGYSQQTIKAEELAAAPAPNWSSGLEGKVAGLSIISSANGPLSSQKIQLRGSSSLNASANGALIVVDGVPMNQEVTTYGNNVPAAYGTDAPVDYGNAISELNQDDIQSVTVLKGASASALYGSRAANGVLIITTKSGGKNQRLGINFSSGVTMDRIIRWPNYQHEYGGGDMEKNADGEFYYSYGNSEDGPSTKGPEAWGPKFEGQSYYQYDPVTQEMGTQRTPWRAYDNMKDFFRNGWTTDNTITLQGGGDKGAMRLSLTHTGNNYIVPNTGFNRNSVSFNGNYQISKAIRISSVFNYNNRSSDNLPAYGLSNGSLGYFFMFLLPNVDINWYKPIWWNGQENLKQLNPFSNWSENPYFITNVETNPLNSNQLVGNAKVDAKINEHLSIMGRVSLNLLTQLRETHRGYSSQKYANGYYGRQDVSSTETNADFLISYENKFGGGEFDYQIRGGGNHMSYVHRNVMSSVTGLVTPGVYNLANGMNNPLVKTADALKELNSFYGMASLGWRDKIFLDITGRNDWSSTLPVSNNSYFYPSLTGSAIVSDLVKLPKSISFLKYRIAYAQVGSDASPYQTAKYYSASSFPSGAIVPSSLYNTDLKPEITASWETGFDLKMLNNRLGIDFTYYTGNTKNQILSVPGDIVTGFSGRIINAGKITNTGVEITLTGTPIKTRNTTWDITANWSTNRNRINELTDAVAQQTLASLGSGWIGYIIATKGGTTSDLWGPTMVRDEKGNIVNANGVPTYTTTNNYIGRTTPDWKGGITNTVRYKNFQFTATVDGQFGGIVKSGSYQRASWAGTTTNTLPGREGDGMIIGKGVMQDANGNYVPNDVAVSAETYWVSYYSHAADVAFFSGSFLKIREVALSYQFPASVIRRTPVKNLTLSLYGRNLAAFSEDPWFDPQAAMQNGQTFIQGVEMTPMPMTASYGFKLNVGF